MDATYQKRLGLFSDASALGLLGGIRRGLEREALRFGANDELAATPHPEALGSALCHPHITTDFAETLLEFVTPVCASIEDLLLGLADIHRVALAAMVEGEYLWSASLPGRLHEEDIVLANYGDSNSGRMRHLYREGLARRYGRRMQTVAGAHYNFSMPRDFWPLYETTGRDAREIATDGYFALLRNCRRHAWLPVYLFGASPLAPAEFLSGREHQLPVTASGDYGSPWASSLRMGSLGYQSQAQDGLRISANGLDEYARDMRRAIFAPHPPYEAIGVRNGAEYLQLNTSVLQIENEYYGVARPKCSVQIRGVAPLSSLVTQGVEYVEFRALDIDPETPLGIRAETLRFLDAFLLYCLLSDSPRSDVEDERAALRNLRLVVTEGRRAELQLVDGDRRRALQEWGLALIEDIAKTAELLDAACDSRAWSEACALQRQRLEEPALTPSARLLADVVASGHGFADMMARRSREFSAEIRQTPPEMARHWAQLAEDSRRRQAALEAGDTSSFDDYLRAWYSSYDF